MYVYDKPNDVAGNGTMTSNRIKNKKVYLLVNSRMSRVVKLVQNILPCQKLNSPFSPMKFNSNLARVLLRIE